MEEDIFKQAGNNNFQSGHFNTQGSLPLNISGVGEGTSGTSVRSPCCWDTNVVGTPNSAKKKKRKEKKRNKKTKQTKVTKKRG